MRDQYVTYYPHTEGSLFLDYLVGAHEFAATSSS